MIVHFKDGSWWKVSSGNPCIILQVSLQYVKDFQTYIGAIVRDKVALETRELRLSPIAMDDKTVAVQIERIEQ